MTQKKWFLPAMLAILFIIFVLLTVPNGYVYGSYIDWLSQHVRLADTIRSACIEQGTLAPAFLPLGGGSNGYQFSYYGYLRPDILLGCLFPSVPMVYFVMGYMLTGYLFSVLLCYYWLGLDFSRITAFFGSVLFMTAACFFHTHRQIMFINYMPFLLLALIAVRKKKARLLPLIMLLIYVNSFYYSIACLVVIGWYWLRQEGKAFWKNGFRCFLKSTFLSVGMAALLLIPTALVILEHRRPSESLSLSEILGVSVDLQALLYSPYGMGLTAVCLYALLLGLTRKKYRPDSIFLLIMSFWCLAAWLLNGTLYARAKILIPFMPLVVLQCVKIFYALFEDAVICHVWIKMKNTDAMGNLPRRMLWQADAKQDMIRWKLWPCFLLAATLPIWSSSKNFIWIAADILLLTCIVFIYWLDDIYRYGRHAQNGDGVELINCKLINRRYRNLLSCILLCIMPCMLFIQTIQKEDFVKKEDIADQGSTIHSVLADEPDSLYRYDSLNGTLNTGNLATEGNLQKSAMYSSITNQSYSDVYYETFQSAVQINNKLAVLPSANPFLLNFLGVRLLETTEDRIPDGYHVVSSAGNDESVENAGKDARKHLSAVGETAAGETAAVIVENPNVLPIAYVSDSIIYYSQFQALDGYGQLDAITRYNIVPDIKGNARDGESSGFDEVKGYLPTFIMSFFPDTIQFEKTDNGYLLNVEKDTDLTLRLDKPLKEQILLLDFEVVNYGRDAVVIDINHMRNKLSGTNAPYPNGNHTFNYQFSSSQGEGLNTLDLTFSKGKYLLKDINWHTYRKQLLSRKNYTSVENHDTGGNEIFSCTAMSEDDSYFITSIPMQKGMKILVDGKSVPILEVNQAFAGAKLEKGTHDIRIEFSAPGQKAGYIISLISFLIFVFPAVLWCLSALFANLLHNPAPADIHLRKKGLNMKRKKELICYCISGGATTFINYLIYFALLRLDVEYLAANTFAWTGAVLTAYVMNRKWVFHSSGRVFQEFCSFIFLRFLTLLAENALLWMSVSLLGIWPIPSKVLVSIITVLSNYVLCKYKIFHKEELKHG